jgi:fatty-acyl-CoA synthase
VPGHEGRAGMAALVTDDRFDFAEFRRFVTERLPVYARPLFVRIRSVLEVTATFKLVSGTLAREGFERAPDPVWFDDHAVGRFVSCDAALARSIVDGGRRL